jgi:hypothetical protein
MVGKIPHDNSLWRRLLAVGAKAGLVALLRWGFWWRLAAFFIASPHPLSMSFGIRDFEGHGEGRCQSALPSG